MKDDLRYTPSGCFETFPFLKNWDSLPAFEFAGKAYCDFRAALMIENDKGLTRNCNRFHDPDECDPRILELSRLHARMDRAVLHVYSGDDVTNDCDFLLDYQIDEESWCSRKKP